MSVSEIVTLLGSVLGFVAAIGVAWLGYRERKKTGQDNVLLRYCEMLQKDREFYEVKAKEASEALYAMRQELADLDERYRREIAELRETYDREYAAWQLERASLQQRVRILEEEYQLARRRLSEIDGQPVCATG